MKFRKKPIVIEAEQLTRDGAYPKGVCSCHINQGRGHLHTIHEGQVVNVDYGDWIIAEADGKHFYPCKDDVFVATYELVEDDDDTTANKLDSKSSNGDSAGAVFVTDIGVLGHVYQQNDGPRQGD